MERPGATRVASINEQFVVPDAVDDAVIGDPTVVAGAAALLLALLTVSFQAIKAAIVNPVKSLRTE